MFRPDTRADFAKAAAAATPDELLDHKVDALPLLSSRMQLWRNAWLTATGYKHPFVPAGMKLEEVEASTADLDQEIKDALCDC